LSHLSRRCCHPFPLLSHNVDALCCPLNPVFLRMFPVLTMRNAPFFKKFAAFSSIQTWCVLLDLLQSAHIFRLSPTTTGVTLCFFRFPYVIHLNPPAATFPFTFFTPFPLLVSTHFGNNILTAFRTREFLSSRRWLIFGRKVLIGYFFPKFSLLAYSPSAELESFYQ